VVLYTLPFDEYGPVQQLLGMRSTHVCTLPPFVLDRVPSILRSPSGYYPQSSNVNAIKGYMSARELVSKSPFVEARSG